jgi:hypothetical protein
VYKFSFRIIVGLSLLTLVALPALAQKANRTQLLSEITALRQQLTAPEKNSSTAAEIHRQLREKEAAFLAPDPGDLAKFAVFTTHWDSGVVRIMPREKFGSSLSLREGGSYYSFAGLHHEYHYGVDLSLTQSTFSTGFAGANFGFLTVLGDVPLETVTLESAGVRSLAIYTPPQYEPDARVEQNRFQKNFAEGDLRYVNRVAATVGQSYAVRSINYNESDVLVAFRVVRQDADGSLILVWKMLQRYPGPRLDH